MNLTLQKPKYLNSTFSVFRLIFQDMTHILSDTKFIIMKQDITMYTLIAVNKKHRPALYVIQMFSFIINKSNTLELCLTINITLYK